MTQYLSTKTVLRTRAKQTLAILSPTTKKEQSNILCEKLLEYIDSYEIRAVFLSFDYEPNISNFIHNLWKQNKTVLVPQIDGASLRLAYYNADSVISQGVYGEGIIKNPLWYDGSLDVCLIPGLAFDRQCNRLGHGKGYYDRFLAANTCFRIGVGYRESIIEKIPCDKWDQTMDIVIS